MILSLDLNITRLLLCLQTFLVHQILKTCVCYYVPTYFYVAYSTKVPVLWKPSPDLLLQLPWYLLYLYQFFWVENNEQHLSDACHPFLSCSGQYPDLAMPPCWAHPARRPGLFVCLCPKSDTVLWRRRGHDCPWPDLSPLLLLNARVLGVWWKTHLLTL